MHTVMWVRGVQINPSLLYVVRLLNVCHYASGLLIRQSCLSFFGTTRRERAILQSKRLSKPFLKDLDMVSCRGGYILGIVPECFLSAWEVGIVGADKLISNYQTNIFFSAFVFSSVLYLAGTLPAFPGRAALHLRKGASHQ